MRAGKLTGVYTGALAGGAAAAAALTAPIAAAWGWRVGLAVWAVLALVAAMVWQIATREQRTTRGTRRRSAATTNKG